MSRTSRHVRRRGGHLLVGAALAAGGLLSTYMGALRPTATYAAVPRNGVGCATPGATEVSTGLQLSEALRTATDGAVICMTNDIDMIRGALLESFDTSLTLDGGGHRLSWPSGNDGLKFDLTNQASADQVTIANLEFSDQFVGVGGAIYVNGAGNFEANDTLTLSNVSFIELSQANLPAGTVFSGGGIFALGLASVEMNNVFMKDNLWQSHGGAYVTSYRITMQDSSFHGNASYLDIDDTSVTSDCSINPITNMPSGPVGAAALLRAKESVSITGTIMWNNSSECDGGALWVSQNATAADTGAVVSIVDSSVAFNESRSGSGGGIHAQRLQELSLLRTGVLANDAAGSGGGLDSRDVTGTFITESGVSYNTAGVEFTSPGVSDGGGVHAYTPEADSRLSIVGSLVLNNQADYSGGGVFSSAATTRLIRSQLMSNKALNGDGGGMYALEPDDSGEEGVSSVEVTDSTVARNTADAGIGGGVRSITQVGSTALTNATFYGNSARRAGALQTPSGRGTITLSTVVGNIAEVDAGAGVELAPDINSLITNSIIWGNEGPSGVGAPGADIEVPGGQGNPTVIRNIIYTSADSVGRSLSRGGIIADPLLAPLGANGGPTPSVAKPMLTMAPLPGSPALGAGEATVFPTDQTGAAKNDME